jgi:hypothetical protein
LLVLNVGGKSLFPPSRRSLEHAARRWDCDFVEVRQRVAPVHIFWQKLFAPLVVQKYSRVLQMDADVLIRSDAPNPFGLVPETSFGVVTADQANVLPLRPFRAEAAGLWADRLGVPRVDDPARLLNAGLLLYSPAIHGGVFSRARACGEAYGWDHSGVADQSSLSALLAAGAAPVEWLPETWNAIRPAAHCPRGKGVTPMTDFVWHFIGPRRRASRIAGTRWRVMPDDESAAPPAVESAVERQLA